MLALLLAALQPVVWYSGVTAGGGLDQYVRRVSDFAPTLTGALLIRNGEGGRLYNLDAQRAAQAIVAPPTSGTYRELVNIYNHPPVEALIVAPLLSLPYGLIFALSAVSSVIAFVLAISLLIASLPLRSSLRTALVLATCAYHPVHLSLWLGQNSAFVLLGLCGAYWAWSRRRDGWLGIALVFIGLKPQMLPLFLLLLVLQQRWRALLAAAAVVGFSSIAAMPILGLNWPLQYANYVINVSSAGAAVAEHPYLMHNWRGMLLHIFGGSIASVVTPLLLALSFATLVAVLLVGRRLGRSASTDLSNAIQEDLVFAFVCLATLLVSPHTNMHDLTLLIVPAWIVGVRATSGEWGRTLSWGWGAILWFGWSLPALALFANLRDDMTVVTSVSLVGGAALLILWQLYTVPVEGVPVELDSTDPPLIIHAKSV